MARVVVGMSGGIDSFVTAIMLQRQGYEVIGVNLTLWGKNDISAIQKNCSMLNIPLIHKDGGELFRKVVVEPFVDQYWEGLTPSPCCICNSYVKWELLRLVAEEFTAAYISTGHYVGIVAKNGKFYIRRGCDPQKDQSYFLWGIPQHILSKAITPLGDYTKAEVKEFALSHGYEEIVKKRESMGICFLQGIDYRDFILQYKGSRQQPGYVLNRAGEEIGEHSGLWNYTIGQKRDMPIVKGKVMYVAEIDAVRNVIVADVKSGLLTTELNLKECQFVSREDLLAPNVKVKIRGLGLNPERDVRIEELPGHCLKVFLSDPAWAVAPGQPVAFYREDLVIGGGWIR